MFARGLSPRSAASLSGGICLIGLIFPGILSAQYSLRFVTSRGEHLSSGFLVSQDGYLATSFHAAQNATAGKLVVGRNLSYDLAGWVAADKGHDIVILAVKNAPRNLRPIALDLDGPPTGAEVIVAAGFSSPQIGQQWLDNIPNDLRASGQLFGDVVQPGAAVRPPAGMAPQLGLPETPHVLVRRRLSGAELLAGLPPRDADLPADAPNTDFFILNVGLETSYVGAPVLDPTRNKIYGLVSGVTDAQGRLRAVIGARHVAALIPQGKVNAKPLSQLKKHEDSVDPLAPPVAGAVAATNYHLSLADRFDAYNERLTALERDVGELRKSVAAAKGKLTDLNVKVDQLSEDSRQIEVNPEETFTTVVEREIRDRDPKSGRVTVRVVREPVTRRRLSARQQQSLSDLATQRRAAAGKLREAWFAWNHDNSFELPLAERRLERGRRELFYLADPFELRSEDHHREFLQRLDDAIAEGGAPGMYFLVRGLCKLRLRRPAEAVADFKDAEDVDGTLEHLVAAAEGRRLILEGDASKGTAMIGKAARLAPNDAAIVFLSGRAETDKKAYTQAARSLASALEKGAEAAETHAALAWLYATTSAGDVTHGRAALTHARQACFATEENDWLCLAALAAAYACNSEFDKAATAIDRAKLLAPLDAHSLCDDWKAAVEAKQPIEREWR